LLIIDTFKLRFDHFSNIEPVLSVELSLTNKISSSGHKFSSKNLIAALRNLSPFLMGIRRVIGGDFVMLE
jgi:hypothetical protein